MRAALLSVLILALACPTRAQFRLSFKLDLNPLVKEERLMADENIRVFVRGSFNNWQGNSHELVPGQEENIYAGTFEFEGQMGDTLSYKFVIEKSPGHFFWEDRADPANPDHGNRRVVLKESKQIIPTAAFQASVYFNYPVSFKKEILQSDFKQFRSILEETHPALYDYTEKSVLDSLFESKYASIQGDLVFSSFLMLMTEVISQVGCGHSSLWIPGDYWTVAPERLFPLKLTSAGEAFYVSGSFTESTGDAGIVPVGSEIRSINGEAMEEIVAHLESLTSADGLNPAFRRAKVAQHFAVKYAMAYGFPEDFTITYQKPGKYLSEEAVLDGVSKAQVDRGIKPHNELSMKELSEGQVALLTINTFAYYGEVPMFKSFMDSVFREIDQKGIDKLILDLRGNGGGDPFCSSYLWAYLQHEPVPYFKDHYGRYDTLANAIPQPARHFKGDLYTLIDGLGFSTTGHFCGLLKYHQVGKFVGSETGATYTCTGNATYPALDMTGIMVGTARVMRYTAAVKNMDPRRGVIPDFPVESTQKDLISGRDGVLEYALSLATAN